MHILIAHDTKIPALEYGGVERLVWWLGKELARLGHNVSYLVAEGSYCDFAQEVLFYNPEISFNEQVPEHIDLVHCFFPLQEKIQKPYIINYQYNFYPSDDLDVNTVFASKNHANRYSSDCYVHHGLDPEDLGEVDWSRPRKNLLFYAYAKRPEKNVKGCLNIARKSGEVLSVVGGKRKWYRWRPWADYKGFITSEQKADMLNSARALLYPVLWHEPFGLSIIESLYFGLPVIGTPYGSLPEIVSSEVGFLSDKESELIEAASRLDQFDPKVCHARVMEHFTSKQMTQKYLKIYEKRLNGDNLNLKPPQNPGNFDRNELLPYYK